VNVFIMIIENILMDDLDTINTKLSDLG